MKKRSAVLHTPDFIQKYGLYVLLTIIAIIGGVVFFDFIILEKLYLFKGTASDSLNDTYPNYILISDYLRNEGIPKWSFQQGMGQSIFPFSFSDPFVSFLYLLGRENLAYGIAYMELLKIFLAAVFFYLFLKKISLSEYAAVIGGILYSFSGFLIVGSCWNWFSTQVVYLAFLLFSYEKLQRDNNRILFPIAIALIAILQPFDLWLMGSFLFIYIVFSYFEEGNGNCKNLFVRLFRVSAWGLLGVGMGSFFFLSEARMMLNSPRVGGEVGYFNKLLTQPVFGLESKEHYITAIMRLFSSDLLGDSTAFNLWHNYLEAPLFYCGLINLLLLPQLFQFLDKRKKILYGLLLAVFIIPVVFPFFRHAFWLFTGDYYRIYSFFVSFVLMFLSLKALCYIIKNRKVNVALMLVALVVLLIILYYPYDYLQDRNVLNEDLRNAIAGLLVVYAVLISLLRVKKIAFPVQLVLMIIVTIELISFSRITVNGRIAKTSAEHKGAGGYLDYTIDAIAYLNKINRNFFRVSKDYSSGSAIHASLNDAKIQGYFGTASYHSFNQKYYVRFLSKLKIIDENDEEQTRWLVGLRNVPLLHAFASVHYFLSKNSSAIRHFAYDSLTTIGDVKVYQNRYALPLGFTYDRYISSSEYARMSLLQQMYILHGAVVVNDSIYGDYINNFTVFHRKDTIADYSEVDYAEDIMQLEKDTLSITKFSQNNINGTINLDEKKMLFFSIPYSEGWSAKVNGKTEPLIRVNIGFTGLLLNPGKYTVELSFMPPLFIIGAVISIISISLYFLLVVIYRRREHTHIAPA